MENLFNYNWELCKLGKLAEFNPKSNLPEKFEYVDLESVVGTELVGHRLENRDSAPSRAQRLAKKNDVFYQTVRPYQKNNYLFDLPYDNYVFSTGYAQMRPSGNGYFLLTLVQEEKFVNRVLERSTGTSYPAISSNDLAKLSVRVPADIEEEQNIGKFFSNLDNLVTLHQRKLDQLKELKKAYLQVMFPVKDERVPKLRLADFEGEWEQCKFFDMWEKSSDRNKELKYSSKDVLSVAKMTKNPVERNSSDEYMKTYNILHYGDIAFEGNKSKDYSFGRFVLNNLQDGIVSHVFIVFKPKVKMDIDFMKVYINNEYFMKHHLVKATTKTLMMTTLNVQDMNKQKLRIPSLNEQERIGKFFKELDHAITLHQNKLTQLNSLKKSYLQNMFI
ncbi:restriction endonuclease subunit S [Enterococcus faecalis]|nr:restriction endonuclease subunit S [Enterococcus faecalis]EGO2618456.1 restriction endonuclease subunit S [Enterococcus faecalis]EHA3054461.1 restriction endonuclease subunit S [Enterococcus faecalis]EHQ8811884.1 restriction endonuclease subunit S [Enterococcus faecalis]EKZ0460974.1 restriction endonuclease subunit S [Enterococcus faecalis]MBV6919365.1 restriction endonuclease subunit S [Enterococcus faecalis]